MSVRPSTESATLKIIEHRHYGRWFSAAVVLLVLVFFGSSIASNPNFEWGVVLQNLTEASILSGVMMTIKLTCISVLFGFAGGTLLAFMRLSANPVLSWVSWAYIWFFRAVPMLVQLFLWYNIATLYPKLSLTLPFYGEIWAAKTNQLISPFSAAVIALVMHQSAYAAEIIRAGIQSVSVGQLEAAKALGYRPAQIFRQTVLPQAMRTILPPAGNEVIGQLKTTAVVSVIALQDVLYSAQIIYQRTYEVVPLLLVATAWYLLMTSVLSVGQHYIERFFSRGNVADKPKWFRAKQKNEELAS
ncbi:amino acid ABC transporter permease [Tatumella sp. TA1]|uniref:amino acid ABC transporter permease n=1 Tax=Rosenbergiella collisarenosi TaxID=1544695 RepID=UPI0008F8FF08|nr:amino acid ABC transporter permease [Rosenbergiella collisarenosi]MBT0721387.1 amino acid ABC transporter permease [Rosenbergiella collisarenosi]QGX92581.1 amino acid ABC transporter permease [Tatumella sp. TA1]